MNRREKLLAGGLLSVLGLWQAGVQYQNFVVAPVAERQAEIESRQKRISTKKIEVAKAQTAMRKYKKWKQRSFPPDHLNATSLYQNWLIELANKSNLSDIVVTASPTESKSKGEVYSLVTADLKANGKLSQIRDFFYEFRNSGLLHRVDSATLTSKQATGDPVIVLNLKVEGLALKEAPARTTLLSDPKLAELVKDPSAKGKDAYDIIAMNSLFVRTYKPPGGLRPGPKASEEDPRQFVHLTSTFSNGEEFNATLYDRTTNKLVDLYSGSEFDIGGVAGKVVSVTNGLVVLEIKGEKFSLEIGHNLTELEKLPAAG